MPATAYSKYFRKELDLQQLLAKMRGGQPQQIDLKAEISDVDRDWIRADVICTCCSVGSPQVVRAGRDAHGNVVRQGHFRFQSPTGEEAHHPLCEFYGHDQGGPRKGPDKVDFGQARTDLTRAVRDLVCRGLEGGYFTTEQMQAMRAWYFSSKVQNRFLVAARPEVFSWLAILVRQVEGPHRAEQLDEIETFDPAFGEMPDYNWRRAAVLEMRRENTEIHKQLRRTSRRTISLAGKIANQRAGEEEFDRSALQAEYTASLELARFLSMNDMTLRGDVGASEFASKGAPAALLAFSALLLFCANYDRREAIRTYIKLTKRPPPSDQTLGNVIGLNPFHDFETWRVVKLAADLAQDATRSFDYFADLNQIEERLRREHQLWREGQGI